MALQMFESSPLAKVKSIIAIAAGKGGVGKSTVTVNLALALKTRGYQVGIIDADIYGPSVRQMLKEEQLPVQRGAFLHPALSNGIHVISMAYFKNGDEASIVRAPIAVRLISQFIQNVYWGELDFLLIDFPPGTGDIQLTLAQQIKLTGAVIVTTPQEVAALDVRKAMKMFDLVKVPLIGIIENMSYFQSDLKSEKHYLFGKDGGQVLAKSKGVPFLGQIPIDPEICQCCDLGLSIFDTPSAEQKLPVQAFTNIAREVISQVKLMTSKPIKSVRQKDEHTLWITWEDGNEKLIRFCELQKTCACARCVDENTGERLLNPQSIKEDVQAASMRVVGNYGLQIQFTSGCSTGIYSFESLKNME